MATTAGFEQTKEEVNHDEVCEPCLPIDLSEEPVQHTPASNCVDHCDVTPLQQMPETYSSDSLTNDETIQGLKKRVEELEELLQESYRTIETLNHLLYPDHSIDGNLIEEFPVSGSDELYSETQAQDQFSSPTLVNFTSHLHGSNYSTGKSPGPVDQMAEEYEDRHHEDEFSTQQRTCDSPLPDSLDECCTPPYSESYEMEEEYPFQVEVDTPMLDSVSALQKEQNPPKIETTKALASRIARTPSQDYRESKARTRALYRRSQHPQSSWHRFSKSSFKECYRIAASASLRSSSIAMRASASFDSRGRPHHQTPRPRRLYQDTREPIHIPGRKTGYPARQPPISDRISKPANNRANEYVYRREHIRSREPEFAARLADYAQKLPRGYSNGTSHNVRHYDEGWSSRRPTSSSGRQNLHRRREYYGERS
ncbi:uncharacterized protein MELLADRAFT_113094 [Melampsora larici-populina 98AG31]|uniref:Uncharacterized protein n=1 Tax=Melampsora larici-populina (strain 98AG31 / pathotype 3-4-7) TaxID=747676 RepID=F4S8Q1_MELLP|nr:uncharacterized protein MELLADRAFT_113094 [Melampsora larici-populina 98AG31]EGF98985.1 hypothetical protein MELLADRAFT_113094 [Melampsora larici-populina 98AG31]